MIQYFGTHHVKNPETCSSLVADDFVVKCCSLFNCSPGFPPRYECYLLGEPVSDAHHCIIFIPWRGKPLVRGKVSNQVDSLLVTWRVTIRCSTLHLCIKLGVHRQF